jgi:hypothetical protein
VNEYLILPTDPDPGVTIPDAVVTVKTAAGRIVTWPCLIAAILMTGIDATTIAEDVVAETIVTIVRVDVVLPHNEVNHLLAETTMVNARLCIARITGPMTMKVVLVLITLRIFRLAIKVVVVVPAIVTNLIWLRLLFELPTITVPLPTPVAMFRNPT